MPLATTTENAYELALQNFDTAADAMGLDNDVRTMIKYPERVLTVSVPVRWMTGISIALKPIAYSTARCAARPRGASAITPRSHSTR